MNVIGFLVSLFISFFCGVIVACRKCKDDEIMAYRDGKRYGYDNGYSDGYSVGLNNGLNMICTKRSWR